MIFRKSLHRSSEDLLRSWLAVLRTTRHSGVLLSVRLPHRRTTKIFFTLRRHHHSSTSNQPCHPPFHPPNSRLSLPKPSPPKPPHTVCTEYIIPDTQPCKSANPPPIPLPSIITALKTLTLSLTIRSRPLLQLPRWSVYPHLVGRVHHRRECRECLISGGDLC